MMISGIAEHFKTEIDSITNFLIEAKVEPHTFLYLPLGLKNKMITRSMDLRQKSSGTIFLNHHIIPNNLL